MMAIPLLGGVDWLIATGLGLVVFLGGPEYHLYRLNRRAARHVDV